MPCFVKKFEIERPELTDSGYKDVDYVLTTREMGDVIKETGIELKDLTKTPFDDPFGDETGSGVIFVSTGGVMESTLQAVYNIVTGTPLEKVLEDIKYGGIFSTCYFIEFMACPGGYIGGEGQPIPTNKDIRKKRMEAIYNSDSTSIIKASPSNDSVLEIYINFFNNSPGGELVHKLLHTTYTKR